MAMLCGRMQSQVSRMSEKGKEAEKEGKPVQICIAETSLAAWGSLAGGSWGLNVCRRVL